MMKPARLLPPLRGLASVLCAAALATPLLAAAATPAAAPTTTELTVFERVMGGGVFFMSALLAISVVMVWLVLDGWLRTARSRLAPEPLAAALRQRLATGDYEGAVSLARRDDSALGRVALAALGQAGHGQTAAEDAVFEQTERERAGFQSRISYLSVIGVITPMIGLNGTVFGMIRAFNTLGAGGAADSARLAAAIGTVLVATAGGLLVAIPAFAAYYLLRNRAAAGFRHLQEQVGALFRHLPYAALRGRRLDPQVFVPALPKPAAAEATLD